VHEIGEVEKNTCRMSMAYSLSRA